MRSFLSSRAVALSAIGASTIVLAACGSTGMSDTPRFSQADFPTSIQVPMGNRVAMETVGVGDITYECRDEASMPGQAEWGFCRAQRRVERSHGQAGR